MEDMKDKCETCENYGFILSGNFSADSDNTPDELPCPDCSITN